MFPETRRNGRLVGSGFWASSGLVVYVAYAAPRNIKLHPVAAGFIAFVGGLTGTWLWTRKYFNDPAALEEYREEVRRLKVKEALKQYRGLQNVLKVLSLEEFRNKVLQEATSELPSVLIQYYGMDLISEFTTCDVLTLKFLRDGFAREVSGTKLLFTDIWLLYESSLPKLFSLVKHLSPPTFELNEALCREYYWVNVSTGTVKESCSLEEVMKADAAAVRPGGTLGLTVWSAVTMYGPWTCETLGVPKEFYHTVLTTCPEGQEAPFNTLSQKALFFHTNGLLRSHWISYRLTSEITQEQHSLEYLDKCCHLRKWLEKGILAPSDIKVPFEAAVRQCSDVITFSEKWSTTLKAHARELMSANTFNALNRAWSIWARAQQRCKEQQRRAEETFAEDSRRINSTLETEKRHLKDNQYLLPEERESRRKILEDQHSRDMGRVKSALALALARYLEERDFEKKSAHEAFRSYLTYETAGAQAEVPTEGCIQQ
eukprot:PhF_6_TR27850/c0_g1_i2/m.40681